MTTLNDTSDKYTWRWQQIYMYIVTNLNDKGDKSHEDDCIYTWTELHLIHHGHVDLNDQLPGRVEK